MSGTALCYGCCWSGPASATERDADGGHHCWKCGSLVQVDIDPMSRQNGIKHQSLIAHMGAQTTLQRDLADRQRSRAVLRAKTDEHRADQARERRDAAEAAVTLARAEVSRCHAAYRQAVTVEGRDFWTSLHAKQAWISANRELATAQIALTEAERAEDLTRP
jgi:hypothetical protein